MTRNDVSTLLEGLQAGSLQVISAEGLRSAFGDSEREIQSLAISYDCEVRRDQKSGDVTFVRRQARKDQAWAERKRAEVEADPDLPPPNVITAEEQREHRTLTGDAAKRPLELGGEQENPHPKEGSRTDPDAG
jgi:hypothetical protein